MNTEEFCNLFYASHYLPVAHYDEDKQISSYCSLEKSDNVFYAATSPLMKATQNPAVFASATAELYGIVRIDGTTESIIVGPVFSGEVSDEAVYGFMRKNALPVEHKNDIAVFLASLPKYTYNQFLNLLAFLHLNINGETISVLEHFHLSDLTPENEIAAKHTVKTVEHKETRSEHGTYHFEKMLLEIVSRGEIDKLNTFLGEALKSTNLRAVLFARSVTCELDVVMYKVSKLTDVGRWDKTTGNKVVPEDVRNPLCILLVGFLSANCFAYLGCARTILQSDSRML